MNIEDFVHNHVHACVSALISENAAHWSEGEYAEELYSILVQDDYCEPVRDWIQSRDADDRADELREWIEALDIALPVTDDLTDVLTVIDEFMNGSGDPDWRELAEALDIEPHEREAYEHWIVSDYLARQLRDRGEMVTTDLYGLTVWGRCTTGQSISMDGVIEEIFKS